MSIYCVISLAKQVDGGKYIFTLTQHNSIQGVLEHHPHNRWDTFMSDIVSTWMAHSTLCSYLHRIIPLISPLISEPVQLYWLLILSMIRVTVGPLQFKHRGRDKMAAVWQTVFSKAFSSMKMYECRLIFYWSWFLRVNLTLLQHWVR